MRIRTRRLTKQCTNSAAKAVNKVTTNIRQPIASCQGMRLRLCMLGGDIRVVLWNTIFQSQLCFILLVMLVFFVVEAAAHKAQLL